MHGAAITPEDRLDKLRMHELSAIESMVKGHGIMDDWILLTNMSKIAETMARSGLGVEVLAVCKIVNVEMDATAHRYEKTRKIGLTGAGIRHIRDLFNFHDLQRKSISRSEYERMIEKTINQIRSGNSLATAPA